MTVCSCVISRVASTDRRGDLMRFRFVLSEIGVGLRRNLAMATSVVLVTFVSLTFVGAAALLQAQVGKMKSYWFDKVEVSVFLCPQDSLAPTCADGEATEDQIDEIEAELESPALDKYIEDVHFEDKEEAWEKFQEQASDWAEIVGEDDMQSSFRIQLVDPTEYDVVRDAFSGRDGVEEVRDQSQVIDPLVKVLNGGSLVAAGLAVVMLVAAVLLITTTIRLSAMSRRRETEIMRLVGASNLFIQLPFMIEGALAATFGAVLAIGALWGGLHYLVEGWLAQEVAVIDYISTAELWTVAPILLAAGIALAGISSLVTLRRYTRV